MMRVNRETGEQSVDKIYTTLKYFVLGGKSKDYIKKYFDCTELVLNRRLARLVGDGDLKQEDIEYLKNRKYKHLSKKDKDNMRLLRSEGHSYRQIATITSKSYTTVARTCKDVQFLSHLDKKK